MQKTHSTTAPPNRDDGEGDEVQEVPAPKGSMDWDRNGRKELLFQQILGCEPNPFLSQLANIKPNAQGKGGVSYDKKATWKNKILAPLKEEAAFKDAAWPADHQAVINFVERIVAANTSLYTSGEEQNEPAAAGTEATKSEDFTPWQQVCAPLGLRLRATAHPSCMHASTLISLCCSLSLRCWHAACHPMLLVLVHSPR